MSDSLDCFARTAPTSNDARKWNHAAIRSPAERLYLIAAILTAGSGFGIWPANTGLARTRGSSPYPGISVRQEQKAETKNRGTVLHLPRPQRRPSLNLTADRDSVQPGEVVTFTLEPSDFAVNSPYKFTFDFGDGTKGVKSRGQATILHRYSAPGSYTVSLSVESAEWTRTSAPKPILANTLRIEVRSPSRTEPEPMEPTVHLEVLTVAAVGRPVLFQAHIVPKEDNIQVRFVFGDGTASKWSAERQTTHTYLSAGSYNALAKIRRDTVAGARPIGKSIPQQIEVKATLTVSPTVNPTPSPRASPTMSPTVTPTVAPAASPRASPTMSPRARPTMSLAESPTVSLAASPMQIYEGQSVSFEAQIVPEGRDIQVSFVFGDDTPATEWSTDPNATHRYAHAGTYQARAQIRDRGVSQTVMSDPRQIEVAPPSAPPRLTLKATPMQVDVGRPVSFQARVIPEDASIRLRFVFGDETLPTEWTIARQTSHTYASSAAYDAYVEIGRISQGVVTPVGDKAVARISVVAPMAARPSGPPWWVFGVIGPVLIFAAYRALKWLFPPRPKFVPFPNTESLDFPEWKEPRIDVQIRLNSNDEQGQHRISPQGSGLVTLVRRRYV